MSHPLPPDLTDDAVLGGRLQLLQPRRGHRAGHDAMLLAAAVPAAPGDRAIDLGAGVGAAGLGLAARVPALTAVLVEIDPDLAALATENARRNGLGERVSVIAADIADIAPGPAISGLRTRTSGLQEPLNDTPTANNHIGLRDSFDHVLCNPPFLNPDRHPASPDPDKRRAHLPDRPRADWIAAAYRLAAPGGVLTLIERADALAAVLADLGDKWGAIEVIAVHPRPDAAAIRVLVRARKGRRTPLSILPALVLADAAGLPTPAAEAILRGAAALP